MRISICIPSYHRREMLVNAITSFNETLVKDFPEHHFRFLCLVQDATDEDKQYYHDNLKLKYNNFKLKFVPKYPPGTCIGKIHKDSVLQFREDLKLTDIIFMSDDDVLYKEVLDRKQFNDNFAKFIHKFHNSNFKIASIKKSRGKVGSKFKFQTWPNVNKKIEVIPMKERFIAIKPDIIDELLTSDMDNIAVGEDVFLFIRALVLGYKTMLVYGLQNYIHLQHETDDNVMLFSGGFLDLCHDSFKASKSMNNQTKYANMAKKTQKSVQIAYSDFFHYDSAYKLGRRLRNDIYDYIKNNIKLDHAFNITRINGKLDMADDRTKRRFY